MTKWHVLQCSVNWNQPDALDYARPVNSYNFHKTAYAAVRNYDRVQTSCRVRNGENTRYDIRIAVSDDDDTYRSLTEQEQISLAEAEDEYMRKTEKAISCLFT